MNYKALFGPLLVCALFLVLGSSTPIAAGSGDEQVSTPQDGPIPPDCPVSNVVAAFNNIPEHGGQPFAFTYWDGTNTNFVGDDPTENAHYQDARRVNGPDGTPYLILNRNGNPIQSGDDYPAELLVVRMGSRSKNGEYFGSNCTSHVGGKCVLADYSDRTVVNMHFTNGYAPEATIGWKHTGSGQVVEGIYAVPLEKTCDSEDGSTACDGAEDKRGAIALIDVSDLPNLNVLKEISTYNGGMNLPTIGVLGVTKESSGRYLFVVTKGNYELQFFRSTTNSLRDPELALTLVDEWHCDEMYGGCEPAWCGNCEWWGDLKVNALGYQTLNFVRDTDGHLFLIGTSNTSASLDIGADYARLFAVTQSDSNFSLSYTAERHLYLNDPMKLGDLDAAAGIYVSPSGKLILYTGPHDNNGWEPSGCTNPPDTELCKAYQMGEFTSTFWEDNIPPVTTHTLAGILGEHGWYVSPVQVTLNASDTCGSGVNLTQYRIDGGAWQTYTDPFDLMSGSYEVGYRSQDSEGNWESEKRVSVRVDTDLPPTGSIRLNHDASRTHSALVQVNPSASDAHSGVWQMRLRDAGGTWAAWQGYTGSAVLWQLPATTGRSYSVEAQFKDWAGNSGLVYTDDIYLDIYPSRPRSSSYLLTASTWGACGTGGSSANYLRQGTLGQPSMIGQLSSVNYAVSSGYWAVQGKGMGVGFIYLPLVLRNR